MTTPSPSSKQKPASRSFSLIPESAAPLRLVEFGRPEWQAHLGGSFHGPEERGGIAQNWAGDGHCWCVLTGLDPSHDHAARLEAAPYAPYGAELQEIRLLTPGGRVVFERVIPVEATRVAHQVRLAPTATDLEFQWRCLGLPELAVRANNRPVAQLEYECRPDLQIRDFLIRRDLLSENTVLTFEPNFSIRPEALEGNPETRVLSFRFFRLLLYRLD